MNGLLGLLGSALDLLLVIVGFGLIIFVHELGHFLAAKWAGIRVLAFAIGFGPAAMSYRKGLGLRRGSSEQEYHDVLHRAAGATTIEGRRAPAPSSISPTEYRLNWLPFGGYVKMLGQDDVNPAAVSDAPDSYQNTPVWKRMVVISAGVVFNVIAAAILFIAVFMHGLKTEPPVIGLVAPGSPASRAVPVEAPGIAPGLKPGDRVVTVNDRPAQSFNDLVMASAMSRKNGSMRMVVQRQGTPIEFRLAPEKGAQSGLLEIGVTPAWTGTVIDPKPEADRELVRKVLAREGLAGVEPGMTLVAAGGTPLPNGVGDLIDVARKSEGKPLPLEFQSPTDPSRRVTVIMTPRAELQSSKVRMPSGALTPVQHLLGLVPVLKVGNNASGDVEPQQGLIEGDIFARVGSLEFPSLAAGITEIHRHRGKTIEVDVLRRGASADLRRITIEPSPTVRKKGEGQIGFIADEADDSNLVALPPTALIDDAGQEHRPPAAAVIDRAGSRVVAVDGRPTRTFTEIRAALREATAGAVATGASARVTLTLALPIGNGPDLPTEQKVWTIEPQDVRALHDLGWEPSISVAVFEPQEFMLVAQGDHVLARAGNAIRMGLAETQRVMTMTYLTFARLFEGTVKVEHLKGPVGIAHMGTRIASRGLVWLLFFMALISVNLAVVNFLPLPIVDGGQFLFLVLEKIRGRPLSIEVQNIATIAGLILIGTMFVIVTFNDIAAIFS